MLPRARERRRGGSAAQPSAELSAAAGPPGEPAQDPAARSPRWLAGRARAWPRLNQAGLRRHWLACLLLAAGLVLRVLAQVAYRPALIYIDTAKYLYGAYPGSDPLGYRAILKIILPASNLATVVAIQHLLGLAMAAGVYVLLLRRGVSRWLAALAMAPVLLDAYQVQMEQMIMPDVWFEAMIVAGLVLLLWRQTIGVPAAVAAGLVLGASATVRQTGEMLIVPAAVYLLAAGGGWRQALTRSAAMAVAFVLPILAYCGVSYARTGHFWLARGQSSIGRTTAAADCATLKVPAGVRRLCPSARAQANGPDWLEHSGQSPLYTTPVPPGTHRAALLEKLGSAIKHQQPLRVAAAIGRDAIRLFALTRGPVRSVTPIGRWQFHTGYPSYPPWTNVRHGTILIGIQPHSFGAFRLTGLNPSYGGKARVSRPIAAFLRGYQLDGGYTPGPLYLAFALAALAGSVLVLARRRLGGRGQRAGLACLLFAAGAVTILLVPDVFEYSWRYELPAVILLPPAGVLGLTALAGWRRARWGQARWGQARWGRARRGRARRGRAR